MHPGIQAEETAIGAKQESTTTNNWLINAVSAGILLCTLFIVSSLANWLGTIGIQNQILTWVLAILAAFVVIAVMGLIVYGIYNSQSKPNRFSFLRKTDSTTSHPQAIEDNEALEILSGEEEDENDPAELFENALSLYEIEISECLIPRKEIVGIELAAGFEAIKNLFVESKHSKLIVYEKDLDNIIGYVHHSDFYGKPADYNAEKLEELVSDIPAVPASMTALEMLTFFKKKQKSIAWVVDEFGGTEGILTTEDLLEELFGEIEDEHDHSEYIEQQISADEFILSGRLEVEYINDKFDLDLPTESAETLSGYIIEEHNAIPEKDEKIILEPYEFKILKVSKTRIETVRLKIMSE